MEKRNFLKIFIDKIILRFKYRMERLELIRPMKGDDFGFHRFFDAEGPKEYLAESVDAAGEIRRLFTGRFHRAFSFLDLNIKALMIPRGMGILNLDGKMRPDGFREPAALEGVLDANDPSAHERPDLNEIDRTRLDHVF